MLRHVARGGIQYSLFQRGTHSCSSAPQLHLVSDAMTGALCAVVCEVSAVKHYQRGRMVESIDRVRLYHQFPNFNDGDCLFHYVFNQPFNTNIYVFPAIQFTKMPTKNPSNSADGSEDGLTQPAKKKVQRGRSLITRSQDLPKRNASRPDKHNVAPLLAEYALANISKTAASLTPISLGDNKTKCKTNQSHGVGKKRTARDVDSVTMPANIQWAAETLTDVAGTQIKSAEISATVVEVLPTPAGTSTQIGVEAVPPTIGGAEVQGATPSVTTEAAGTQIKSAASSSTVMEVLTWPAGASTQINPEAYPPTLDSAEVQGATPSDKSTRINAVASLAMGGVGVDVTRSSKNIGPTGPPPDDGAMEVVPRPVGTSTIINSAADDKPSTSTAAAPSIASGLSPGSVLQIMTVRKKRGLWIFENLEIIAFSPRADKKGS
jgi:hypothetical protein